MTTLNTLLPKVMSKFDNTFLEFETNLPLSIHFLRVRVEVYNDNDELLDLHEITYSPDTRKAYLSLKAVLKTYITAPLPSDASLSHQAQEEFAPLKFRIEYFEVHSNPVVRDTTQISNWVLGLWGDSKNVFLDTLKKQVVTPSQPSYMSVLSLQGSQYCIIETIFLLSNDNEQRRFTPYFTLTAEKITVFPVGIKQLQLPENTVSYTIKIHTIEVGDDRPPITLDIPQPRLPAVVWVIDHNIIAEKQFVVQYRGKATYLAFCNAIGGIATAYFPIEKQTISVERKATQIHQFQEQSHREGDVLDEYISKEIEYILKTDILPPEQFSQTAQILLGPVWLIAENKFIKVALDTKKIDMPNRRVNGQIQINIKRDIL